MKFFLETCFFGYLTLKWKRLARVISFVLTIAVPSVAASNSFDEESAFIYGLIVVIVVIPLISWVLKPFILNEED